MVFNLVLVFAIIILLVILSMVWPTNSPWAPWWRTNRKTARAICRLAEISKDDIVYDLGCGDGTFIITTAKEFGAKAVGIEIEQTRFLISKIRIIFNGLSSTITAKRENFFNTDLSNATVVIVYLIPKTLEKLLPKFQKELKKGAKIVSYKYPINLKIKKEDSKNNLYLYII